MPNYRRAYVPGGTFFFTVVTHGRRPLFPQPAARSLLGDTMRECMTKWPYFVNAIVLLPDHLPRDLDATDWRHKIFVALGVDQTGL